MEVVTFAVSNRIGTEGMAVLSTQGTLGNDGETASAASISWGSQRSRPRSFAAVNQHSLLSRLD